MTTENVKRAVAEAERFIVAAQRLLAERKAADDAYGFIGTKASGACRRASLDATRALAEMRR